MSKRARMAISAAVAAGIAGMAFAIAISLKQETCDIDVRIPEERALVCELQRRGDTPDCPPEDIMPRERCQELLDRFSGHGDDGGK